MSITVRFSLVLKYSHLIACLLSISRYKKRKQRGNFKTTSDLTKKQHEKKKKQWRENSKKYSRRKKQLEAVLDMTPSSDEDTLQQVQEPNEDTASPREQSFSPQQVNVTAINVTPKRKERPLQTSTPKASQKKRNRRKKHCQK